MFWDKGVGEAVQAAYGSTLQDAARVAGDEIVAALSRPTCISPTSSSTSDNNNDEEDEERTPSLAIPQLLAQYDLKKKKYLSVLNRITRKMYEAASDEEKETVAEEIESRYQRRLAAYHTVQKPMEDYQPGDYAVYVLSLISAYQY